MFRSRSSLPAVAVVFTAATAVLAAVAAVMWLAVPAPVSARDLATPVACHSIPHADAVRCRRMHQ